MAAALGVSLSLPFSNSTSLSTKTIFISPENITFKKGTLCNRKVSAVRKVFSIRGDAKTEVAGKVSKKQVEGVVENKFTPTDPLISKCLLNNKITRDDAPEEAHHMVFSTEGELPNREGQTVAVIPDGVDSDGKPRYYTIASSARGDFGDYKTVSLCVKRDGGVGSNFLCNLEPGAEAKIIGPIGKKLLMPKDPNATIIMLATGTGIAPFRAFMWKMFSEEHDDYKFNGLAWLFFGVPTSSSLLYKEEFEKMKEKAPKNIKLDYALSREQTNEKGEKMYIQNRMAEYAEELWSLLKKDSTFVYMCGLKDMEQGIDDLMTSIAQKHGVKWADYKKQLEKAEQWAVEVY